MTLVQCAADAARKLEVAGVTADESRRDAVVLARWCLGWSAADWLTRAQQPATAEFSTAFAAVIDRRARREPLAYITGEREFYGRMFDVTPAVLIPRPETELLVEEALRCLQQIGRQAPHDQVRPQVLDIGTGSGCVAITLALEAPAAAIIATDVSTPALDVARRNARRLQAADRIEFRQATFAEEASGVFDLIVANPPYVPEPMRASLAPEVREYEPADALFAGRDGLDVIRRLVPSAARALRSGGWLVIEMGMGQADEVGRLMRDTAGFSLVRFARDLQGIDRVVVGTG